MRDGEGGWFVRGEWVPPIHIGPIDWIARLMILWALRRKERAGA